jgi:hypothetical protein
VPLDRIPSFCSHRLTDQTLTVFLGAVLSKRYTNPSSDIISVLAGLDDVDTVFSDLVAALDNIIRNGRDLTLRKKAIRVALASVAGAYQTGLVSYFTHRDLFPALMKLVNESGESGGAPDEEQFVLLALLANYNRFEFQNPYRMRLDDFVNDAIMKKIVRSVGDTCKMARDRYTAIQNDLPEGWSLGGTLSYIGLGALTPGSRPSTPVLSDETAKLRFADLPGPEAGLLLSTYDFVTSNKLFCYDFVMSAAESKTLSTPFGDFLSLTSYLFQHAHRSSRATLYTYTSLFILQILLEEQTLAKRLCSDESKSVVRLCRQRQPYLPAVTSPRPLGAAVLDVALDGINHNLRRKLDTTFYLLNLSVLHRLISFLGASRIRLTYHWSELWRGLLSFMRFLNTYADDVRPLYGTKPMVDELIKIIALALATGESFLSDPASYDDLFYKLVETGDILTRFRDTYDLGAKGAPSAAAIGILVGVSEHYHSLLDGGKKQSQKRTSTREVAKVIKQGYDTLSIDAKEGLDTWYRFREADYRVELKRIARVVVEDAKLLIRET